VCTVPDTKNNMESRVTDGNVVLPTGNRTDSVKVYNIATQKIITRDQFKICPMPDSVIDCLNKQALAEGRRVKSNHMHVFDELLNCRKLSTSPTYFTPLPMQDRADAATIYPHYQPPPLQPEDAIRRDRPSGDTNDSGGGPAVPNDFSALPDDAEGSDQEQDITYDQNTTYDRDPDEADGGVPEDSGLTPPSPLPLPPLPSCRVKSLTTSEEQCQ
jgi:hypothetical protein